MRKLLVIFVMLGFAAALYYTGAFEPGIEKLIIGKWKTAGSEEILEFFPDGKIVFELSGKKASAGYHFPKENKMTVYFDQWENPGGNPIRVKATINQNGNLEIYAKQSTLVYERYYPQDLGETAKEEEKDVSNSTEND